MAPGVLEAIEHDPVIKLGVLATLKNWFIEGLFGDVDEVLRAEIKLKARCLL